MKRRFLRTLIFPLAFLFLVAPAFEPAAARAELSADSQIRPFFKQGVERIFDMDEKGGTAALLQGIELDRERPIGYAYLAMANLFFLETSFEDRERERRQEDMLKYAAEAVSRQSIAAPSPNTLRFSASSRKR